MLTKYSFKHEWFHVTRRCQFFCSVDVDIGCKYHACNTYTCPLIARMPMIDKQLALPWQLTGASCTSWSRARVGHGSAEPGEIRAPSVVIPSSHAIGRRRSRLDAAPRGSGGFPITQSPRSKLCKCRHGAAHRRHQLTSAGITATLPMKPNLCRYITRPVAYSRDFNIHQWDTILPIFASRFLLRLSPSHIQL